MAGAAVPGCDLLLTRFCGDLAGGRFGSVQGKLRHCTYFLPAVGGAGGERFAVNGVAVVGFLAKVEIRSLQFFGLAEK